VSFRLPAREGLSCFWGRSKDDNFESLSERMLGTSLPFFPRSFNRKVVGTFCSLVVS
jgi:hypothetical protein